MVYICIRIIIPFLFRTYFTQQTLSNGRVEYGPILVTRVIYPCAERTKLKRKKKNRFKFVKLNLSFQERV